MTAWWALNAWVGPPLWWKVRLQVESVGVERMRLVAGPLQHAILAGAQLALLIGCRDRLPPLSFDDFGGIGVRVHHYAEPANHHLLPALIAPLDHHVGIG